MVLLSPSSPESSSTDDSFRSSISLQRRDRSMPPRALDRIPLSVRDYKQPFSPCERFRRERNQYDSYLYPAGHTSLTSHLMFSTEISPDSSLSRVRQLQRNGSPSTSNGVTQLRVDTHGNKSQSSLDNTDEEQSSSNATANHNRRDSGVGSSLSRSPSGPSAQRIRQSVLPYTLALSTSLISSSNNSSIGSWQAAKRRVADRTVMTSSLSSSASTDETFFTDVQMVRCVDSLSVVELARLHKLAYLRVTAILEKHMGPGSTVKIGEWKRQCEEGSVFGQPLDVIYKKTGQCLPRTILEVIFSLILSGLTFFYILEMKLFLKLFRFYAEADVFVDGNRLDPGQQLKIENLNKNVNMLSRLPLSRLTALQYAILLLPDEHREALQTLLFFLNDIAKHSELNNVRNSTSTSTLKIQLYTVMKKRKVVNRYDWWFKKICD
uniref:Rho-GAP domain-containing protein n=1 Tax=Heterorhabditis bacteriophora TaxID=37862 RepID=A0A1I7XBI8_HETBA